MNNETGDGVQLLTESRDHTALVAVGQVRTTLPPLLVGAVS